MLGVVEGRATEPLGAGHSVGALDFDGRVGEADTGEVCVEGPEVGTAFDRPAVQGRVVGEALAGMGLSGAPEPGKRAVGSLGLAGLPEWRVTGGGQRMHFRSPAHVPCVGMIGGTVSHQPVPLRGRAGERQFLADFLDGSAISGGRVRCAERGWPPGGVGMTRGA